MDAQPVSVELDPLERMRQRFDQVRQQAMCNGQLAQACAAPDPSCPYSSTVACSARLRQAEADAAVEKVRLDQEERRSLAQMIGLPKRLWSMCRVESDEGRRFVNTEAMRVLTQRMDGVRLMILAGTSGSGKSVAAACWAWSLRLARTIWYPAQRLSWSRLGDLDYSRLLDSRYAVIDGVDEVWIHSSGPHTRNLRYALTQRYDAMLTTVLTTDIDVDEDLYRVIGYRWKDATREDVRYVVLGEHSWRGHADTFQREPGEDDEPLDHGVGGEGANR